MVVETSTGNPYNDIHFKNYFLREFDSSIDESELIWHRDKRDRTLRVKGGTGWLLQFDNELPIELVEGEIYTIKKETYHRLIKGDDNLLIEIYEK